MSDRFSDLLDLAHAAAHEGLAISTSGNASVRQSGNHMAITGTGTSLATLAPAQVSVVRLSDGQVVEGPPPSREVEIHRLAYLTRPLVRSVLHCQSPWATLAACLPAPPPDLNFIPEFPVYVRAWAHAPWHLPGSAALAEDVATALRDPDVTVVQMANHGQLVVGVSGPGVIRRARFFEMCCWMALQGRDARPLPAAEVARLRTYAWR